MVSFFSHVFQGDFARINKLILIDHLLSVSKYVFQKHYSKTLVAFDFAEKLTQNVAQIAM